MNNSVYQVKTLEILKLLSLLLQVRYEESEIEFEDEVDLLMSSDIVSAQISTKPITFSTVQSGWFFKEDRK